MPNEPHWLTPEQIVEINQVVVHQTGEPFCILNQDRIEGALWHQQTQWVYDGEEDVVVLAIALLFGVARSHAFEQGNKRTGFLAARAFMNINGYDWDGPDYPGVGQLICEIIDHQKEQAEFRKVFEPFVIIYDGADPLAAP